eukprot:scaffold8784_cov105-Isochrysis_galbana.AAC.2
MASIGGAAGSGLRLRLLPSALRLASLSLPIFLTSTSRRLGGHLRRPPSAVASIAVARPFFAPSAVPRAEATLCGCYF